MSVREEEVMVAQALALAVQRAGRGVGTEPLRVHGLVNDVLGAEARTRRAEIDAVVIAAEERVPERLMSDDLDVAGAKEMLRGRGLDLDTSEFAVEVWRFALGLLEVDAEPPSMTVSVDAPMDAPGERPYGTSTDRVVSPPESVVPESYEPEPVGATVAGEAGPGVEPVRDGFVADDTAPSRRFPLPLGIAAAAGVMLVVALVVVLVRGGDKTETASEKLSDSSAPASVQAFAVDKTALGELRRSWTLDEGRLKATLVFENNTAAATSGRHYEVIPKSLAKSASQVTSNPAHKVIEDDPVIAWELKLDPGKSVTVTYEVVAPKNSGKAELKAWAKDQATETAAFEKVMATKPVLEISTPPNQQLAVGELDLVGKTDPTSKIAIGQATPAVGPDGSWTQHLSGLAVGPNVVKVIATSQYGVKNEADFPVTVLDPVVVQPESTPPGGVDTTTGRSNSRRTTASTAGSKTQGGSSGSSTETTAPPRVTTTTAKPRPISISITGGPSTWYQPPP